MSILTQAVDSCPTAFIIIDHKGIIVETNKITAELFGYTKEELIGVEVEILLPESLYSAHKEHIKNFFTNPSSRKLGKDRVLLAQKKDGTELHVEIGVNFFEESGKVFGVANIVDITEEYRIQKLLLRTQEVAKVGSWQVDLVNNKCFWSKVTYQIHELDESEEVYVEDGINFYAKEHQDKIRECVQKGINERKPWDVKLKIVTTTGKEKWVHAIGAPVIVKDKVVALEGTFQDIDEQVKKNELLDLVISNTIDGYWDWYLKEDYEYMSPRFWEIFGFSPEEKKHHPSEWQKLIFEEDLQIALKNFDLHVKTKGDHPFYQEARYRHKNGSTVWVICKGNVVEWDSEGQPVRMIGTHVDITKEKEAQKVLEKSNERYELMTEGASVGIWDWVDVNNSEEVWSDKFYQLLGFEPGEIEASLENFGDMLHPEDKEETFKLLDAHFKDNTPFDLNYRLRTKSGYYKWFRGSGQVSRDSNGKPVRMVGSIQDINDQVLGEIDLKRSNEELDQFAYIASHDLREPLRGMRNFSQFLIEDYAEKLDDDGVKYLNTIKKLGARLEGYLDSLLYYSRLGREEAAYKDIDLNVFLQEVKDTHTDASQESRVNFEFQDNLPTINCDPIKLKKILGNLMQNAIRYNVNEKKEIRVEYKNIADKMHQFWVKDNGIGMKKDHWDRIFVIFKRLHSKDEFDEGSGLGLSMAKKAVEQHGGKIWVESSSPEKGSSFTFTIQEK